MSDLSLVTQSGLSLEFTLNVGPIADWYMSVVNATDGTWDIDNKMSTLDLHAAAEELGILVRESIDPKNQHRLNHWHRQFEMHCAKGLFTDKWARINTLIHHIESRRGGSVYLALSRSPDLRQIIDPCLYPYWSHIQQEGDLCLGFNTIGKTLSSCWIDRDQQQLSQGTVVAQTDLHSQAVLTIARPTPPTHQHRAREIQAWVERSAHTQDLSQGLHQYHGCPLIARVTDLAIMHTWYRAVQLGDDISHWETC